MGDWDVGNLSQPAPRQASPPSLSVRVFPCPSPRPLSDETQSDLQILFHSKGRKPTSRYMAANSGFQGLINYCICFSGIQTITFRIRMNEWGVGGVWSRSGGSTSILGWVMFGKHGGQICSHLNRNPELQYFCIILSELDLELELELELEGSEKSWESGGVPGRHPVISL